MEKHLSNRINSLSESQTIAMSAKSREMKDKGIDVISLSLGEPDFNTPEFIKEAGIEAIKNNFTHYPPVPGYLELRQAISNKFKRDNNLSYSPSQIVVSTGAKQSLANVILSLVNEGDEVIVPTPYWVSYIELIKLAGGKPVFVSSSIDTEFKITPDQLENAITDNSKLMIFSSPCNPSG
ncbi:MAG: aminotransferase class I/II-fold pyridoxal phosphate-dependent enzyme, partial [Flavobacteriales bacterium]